jgi:hypothetical protein
MAYQGSPPTKLQSWIDFYNLVGCGIFQYTHITAVWLEFQGRDTRTDRAVHACLAGRMGALVGRVPELGITAGVALASATTPVSQASTPSKGHHRGNLKGVRLIREGILPLSLRLVLSMAYRSAAESPAVDRKSDCVTRAACHQGAPRSLFPFGVLSVSELITVIMSRCARCCPSSGPTDRTLATSSGYWRSTNALSTGTSETRPCSRY